MKLNEINIRDPFVLVHEDKYYLYGTRGATCWGAADGFDVYVSADLAEWSEPQVCFHNDGSFWATENYWAPEVYAVNGSFYMAASFKAEGVCRGTCLLRAQSPLGPFAPYSDGALTPHGWECLDGTLYFSPQGKPYLIFCHEWTQIGDGTVCAMPLGDDLRAPAGEPFELFCASFGTPWVKSVYHKRTGITGYVTDGPFPYRTREGRLLILWSSFSESGYTLAMAASDNGDVTGRFTQLDPPLYERDGGHGMVFRSLDGRLLLALHNPNEHLKERPVLLMVGDMGDRLRMV